MDPRLDAKRLELLKATLPALSRVAVSYNPAGNVQQMHQLMKMETAAPTLGVEIRRVGLLRVEDLDRTFARLQRDHIGALRIQSDPVTDPSCGRIAELARSCARDLRELMHTEDTGLFPAAREHLPDAVMRVVQDELMARADAGLAERLEARLRLATPVRVRE